MKAKFWIGVIPMIILSLTDCNKRTDPAPLTGCWTGMRDGKRQLIDCCLKNEYLAGNNVAAGGVSWCVNYTDWKYEPSLTCQTCQDKYQ